ncbi:MAG: Gx transporter family protein [Clostridia bacterium]|nr:Gx transporter family protein [Clostridia bacterium]
MKIKLHDTAMLGLLTAVALVLSYIEHLIPLSTAVPGIKLGLSNTVVLYALFLAGKKQAVLLVLLKVFISGFAFSGVSAMLYSFCGGILSILCMLFFKRFKGVSVIGVSVVGAAAHNIGQCLVALGFIAHRAILLYLPFLLVSAVITGVLTGITAEYIFKHLSRRNNQ